jgi:hypothetical protein
MATLIPVVALEKKTKTILSNNFGFFQRLHTPESLHDVQHELLTEFLDEIKQVCSLEDRYSSCISYSVEHLDRPVPSID